MASIITIAKSKCNLVYQSQQPCNKLWQNLSQGVLVICISWGVSQAMQKEDVEIQTGALQYFPEEYLVGEPLHPTAQSVLRQIKALNQFTTENSSAASCGYHALRNGLSLLDFAHTRSRNCLSTMNSASQMSKTFTEWQVQIKRMRFQRKFAIELAKLVMTRYKGSTQISMPQKERYGGVEPWSDEKFKPLIQSKVSSVIGSIFANQTRDIPIGREYRCALRKELIAESFKKLTLENSMHNSGDSRALDQFLVVAFDSLFESFEIDIRLSSQGELFINGLQGERFLVNTDWLDNGEIASLLQNQNSSSLANRKVKCLFYASVLSESERKEFVDLRNQIQQNEIVTALILISTSESNMSLSSITDGHWFALVASNGEYFVADSLPGSRIGDPHVSRLVSYLVGVSALLDMSDNQMSHLAAVSAMRENLREPVVSASLHLEGREDKLAEDHMNKGDALLKPAVVADRMSLFDAVTCGNLQLVTQLLLSCDDIRKKNEIGQTPLYLAAEKGDTEILKLLIQRDKKMDSNQKRDLLLIAAKNGHEEVVNILLDSFSNDAIIHQTLFVAAQHGHASLVKRLLKFFEKSETFTEIKKRLFWVAAVDGYQNIVELLLNVGVDAKLVRDDGETPLSVAAQNGHLEVVKRLLKAKFPVDGAFGSKGVYGYTVSPLFKAAQSGHSDIVRLLIRENARINCFPSASLFQSATSYEQEVKQMLKKQGECADLSDCFLGTAAFLGDVAFVEALLKAGENPSRPDKFGLTPLHNAAIHGHVEVVNQLVAAGAAIKVKDKDGLTPLCRAGINGHVDVVRLLLAQPANDQNGESESSRIAVNGYRKLVECLSSQTLDQRRTKLVNTLLAAGGGVGCKETNGMTLLHRAAEGGHVEVVKLLLERGADPRVRNDFGATPLDLAVDEGWVNVVGALVKALLTENANLSMPDKSGLTLLLHRAASKGHVSVVNLLLGKGVDSNMIDDGLAPLHCAAMFGHAGVVQALIASGAKVGIVVANCAYTALHLASMHDFPEVVEILLAHGAEPNVVDIQGRTPLDSPVERGYINVVEKLVGAGARSDRKREDGMTLLHLAVQWNDNARLVELLARAADVNVLNDILMTPLHVAAMFSRKDSGLKYIVKVEIVKLLLNAGARVDLVDINGMTSLHWSAVRGSDEIARLLLERGADVNAAENVGLTPLHIAAQNGHIGLTNVLLSAGANLKAVDNEGNTPLDLALKNDHTEVIELLKKANCG